MKLEDLIKRCIKNDRNAQNELFRKYKDTLFFISLKYCRNVADAEDNLHDAFIAIFQNLKTFKNHGSFEGWMKRIAIYKAVDKYKNNLLENIEIKDNLLVDSVEIHDELDFSLEFLLKLVQELPDQYRLVFNLYQLDAHSHKEIASILNISEGTSKSNYHRAKLILREKIEKVNNRTNSEKEIKWQKKKI